MREEGEKEEEKEKKRSEEWREWLSSIQDTFIESEYLEGGPGTAMEAVILLESVWSIGSLNQEAHTHS